MRRMHGWLAAGTIVVLLLALMVTPSASATGITYVSTPTPGLVVGGTAVDYSEPAVLAVDVVGSVAYIGGDFTSVTGRNGRFVRNNLAAVNIVTQEVLPDFIADTDAPVYAVKAAGPDVFVGGRFRALNGSEVWRVAAINSESGALRTDFTAKPSSTVRALDLAGGQLWLGGGFDYVSGNPRAALASVDPTSGAVSTVVADVNGPVRTIKASRDGSSVFVGGDFTTVGKLPRGRLAQVTTGGAVTDLAFPELSTAVDNQVLSLAVDPVRNVLYGGVGGVDTVGLGNQVVAWNLTTGLSRWKIRAGGDIQAVAQRDNRTYFGFHEEFGGNTSLKLLAADSDTGALDPAFRPALDSFYGVWAIAATPLALVVGGAFRTVNGVDHRKLAAFPLTPAPIPRPSVQAFGTKVAWAGTSGQFVSDRTLPLAVRVSRAGTGDAVGSGTVRVVSGSRVLCTAPVRHGLAECSVKLRGRTASLIARYSPGPGFSSSSTPSTRFRSSRIAVGSVIASGGRCLVRGVVARSSAQVNVMIDPVGVAGWVRGASVKAKRSGQFAGRVTCSGTPMVKVRQRSARSSTVRVLR